MSWFRPRGQAPEICSFCGTAATQPGRFIGGPGGRGMCSSCVLLLPSAAAQGSVSAGSVKMLKVTPDGANGGPKPRGCDFCGKPASATRWLVAGPAAVICDECSDLCQEILAG